jgi:hypothetical protein
MQQFRIYYSDGVVHDDVVETAPSYGVLVILQRRSSDGRWYISSNAPYYAHTGKEWLHFYENDMVDYLVHKIPIDKLIVGRMVDKAEFSQVYEQAKRDRDTAD